MNLRLSSRHRPSMWLALGLVAAISGDVGPRAQAQQPVPRPRIVESADDDWRFSLGDFASAAMPAFDDAKWARVDLPHDWSADGPFSAKLRQRQWLRAGWHRLVSEALHAAGRLEGQDRRDRIRRRLRLRRSVGQRPPDRRAALRLLELRMSADAVREVRRHGQRRRRARRPLAICRLAVVHGLRHLPARSPALHRPAPSSRTGARR